MIVTVTIETDSGSQSYTGHVVCRGPSTMEMLLTEPFSMAGRTVQFPRSTVVTEANPVAGAAASG
ncbi:MAG: hypothetical protein ACRDVD_09100 [Acidimicrobiia bacterium]